MIKNVIFDVGQVLVAWEPVEAMRALGMDEETVRGIRSTDPKFLGACGPGDLSVPVCRGMDADVKRQGVSPVYPF